MSVSRRQYVGIASVPNLQGGRQQYRACRRWRGHCTTLQCAPRLQSL
jgi:hypothetical protein